MVVKSAHLRKWYVCRYVKWKRRDMASCTFPLVSLPGSRVVVPWVWPFITPFQSLAISNKASILIQQLHIHNDNHDTVTMPMLLWRFVNVHESDPVWHWFNLCATIAFNWITQLCGAISNHQHDYSRYSNECHWKLISLALCLSSFPSLYNELLVT